MRLRRLDLTRYGKFTDRQIDFGAQIQGSPDLHIVYGPNEAGKSTAFAAFLDLLFGIESRSRYNFLHPYPSMRIGASLELSAGPRDFVRIKSQQRSLLGPDDQPLPDGVILAELSGLDRNAYRTMFSLDDETLEIGGESILASKGDLGQLLFAASAGLADLSRTLSQLRAEADEFTKPRGRTGKLQDLKASLASLKAERDRIDTFANEYAKLLAEKDRASGQYDITLAERGLTKQRMDEIQRHLNALPRLAALHQIREKLQPLATLPKAPTGWREALPTLLSEETRLATSAAGIDEEIERLTAETNSVAVDEAAEAVASRFDQLAEPRARHLTAQHDIPLRTNELRDIAADVARVLAKLGHPKDPDPARLLIKTATVAALRHLIETRSGIQADIEQATAEHSDAVYQLEEAWTALRQAGASKTQDTEPAPLIASLEVLLDNARTSDHAARHRVAARSRDTLNDELAIGITALRPWNGTIDDLQRMPAPTQSQIELWKASTDHAQSEIMLQKADLRRLEDERANLLAEQSGIAGVTGILSDQEAAAIRSAREAAWADHRRQLDAETAETFEAALRRDDVVMGVRLGHERDLARLHDTAKSLAMTEARHHRTQDLLIAAEAALETARARITAACAAMGPSMPLLTTTADLQTWLTARAKALDVHTRLRQAERDIAHAEEDATILRNRLIDALTRANFPHQTDAALEALIGAAQSRINQEFTLQTLRKTIEDREREVRRRERALQKSATNDRAWHTAWAEACGTCWLQNDTATPLPAAVGDTLSALSELAPLLESQDRLASRIADMQRDASDFERELSQLSLALDMPPSDQPAQQTAVDIETRIQHARAARIQLTKTKTTLNETIDRRRKVALALAGHETRKTEMTTYFGAETLQMVSERLQETEKKSDLERRAEEAERDILGLLHLSSLTEAEHALAACDRPTLELELSGLESLFNDQDKRTHELFAASKTAADHIEAIGGDNAAARIEEQRRTIMLDIEDQALRYLGLRAGIVAAETALRAYRDKHRSTMMTRASNAFQTVSGGAYRGLGTRPEKDGETLIALGADGSSKIASELSKGTRFQLYLALRAAGYHEFATTQRPVPFIADDIMETFDDVRAAETFQVLADMAGLGQVIYLTHHQHLCEIARHVVPGVRIHDLSS